MDFERLLNSFGTVAEVLVIFYKACRRSGATEKEAETLTRIVFGQMFDGIEGRSDNND